MRERLTLRYSSWKSSTPSPVRLRDATVEPSPQRRNGHSDRPVTDPASSVIDTTSVRVSSCSQQRRPVQPASVRIRSFARPRLPATCCEAGRWLGRSTTRYARRAATANSIENRRAIRRPPGSMRKPPNRLRPDVRSGFSWHARTGVGRPTIFGFLYARPS
jgi:hypothetical protein